ncbi:MAG: ABC transporter permease [Clostridia bacterium]
MLKASLKKRKGTLALLAIALVGLVYACVSAGAMDTRFQFAYPAPPPPTASTDGPKTADEGAKDADKKQQENTALRDARNAAKDVTKTLEGACENNTLYAVGQPGTASIERGGSVSMRLMGIEQSYYAINAPTLTCGRLIYPDEFSRGERVALVDEQLAVALFQYAEPLGESLLVAGEKYQIVGVVRAHKQVGDEMEYAMYVPYRALEKSSEPMKLLVYEASPVKGAGGWTAFESAVKSLSMGGGTAISLSKERMNATMPARMLGILCGLAVMLYVLSLLGRAFRTFMRRYRERLMVTYAARMLWWTFWRGALLLLGYAACALVLAQLFVWLLEPVYTFPEWVPAVLVEPKDIQNAFWNVWQKPASAVEYRTPELLRLRFFRELCGWTAGLAALLLGSLYGTITGLVKPEVKAEAEHELTEAEARRELEEKLRKGGKL